MLAAVCGRKCCGECLGGESSCGTGGCFAYMYVGVPCVCLVPITARKLLDLLKLESQIAMSCHVCAGNRTQVL